MPWINAGSHANISLKKRPDHDLTKLLSPPSAEETDSNNPHLSESRATSELELVHDDIARNPKIYISENQRPPEVIPVDIHCVFLDESEPSPSNNSPSSGPTLHSSVGLQTRNTLREQSASGILGKRRRIPRVIVSEELAPLISRTGKSFVDAWVDAVTCMFVVNVLPFSRLY